MRVVQQQIVILNGADGDSSAACHLVEHAWFSLGRLLRLGSRHQLPEIMINSSTLCRRGVKELLHLGHVYLVRIKRELDLGSSKVFECERAIGIGLAYTC